MLTTNRNSWIKIKLCHNSPLSQQHIYWRKQSNKEASLLQKKIKLKNFRLLTPYYFPLITWFLPVMNIDEY